MPAAAAYCLVDRGRKIGHIRGYPGEDFFWGLLGALVNKLDASATGDERMQLIEKALRVNY